MKPDPRNEREARAVLAPSDPARDSAPLSFPSRPPGVELKLRCAADKADRRRFTGEPITGFGSF